MALITWTCGLSSSAGSRVATRKSFTSIWPSHKLSSHDVSAWTSPAKRGTKKALKSLSFSKIFCPMSRPSSPSIPRRSWGRWCKFVAQSPSNLRGTSLGREVSVDFSVKKANRASRAASWVLPSSTNCFTSTAFLASETTFAQTCLGQELASRWSFMIEIYWNGGSIQTCWIQCNLQSTVYKVSSQVLAREIAGWTNTYCFPFIGFAILTLSVALVRVCSQGRSSVFSALVNSQIHLRYVTCDMWHVICDR